MWDPGESLSENNWQPELFARRQKIAAIKWQQKQKINIKSQKLKQKQKGEKNGGKKHAKTATTAQMLNGKWGWHIKKGEHRGPEEVEKDREPGT